MKTAARVALALALAFAPCLAPSPAHAQPGRAKAKPLPAEDAKLRSGIALFDAREFDKAAAELERLHGSTGEPRALLWMGKALQEGGHLSAALRAFKRYGKELPKTDARNIELLGIIQTLTMQVATVTVNAPDGATIAVDGDAIGTAPLGEPVHVDPGAHTITATRGKEVATKTVQAQEEGRDTVDLRLAPPEPPAAPPPTPAPTPTAAPPSTHAGSSTALTVGGLGLATALAAGSAYFALSASQSASDLESKKRDLGVSRADLDGLQSTTRVRAGLSVGLGVAALGVAGVTLFVLKKPKTEAPPPPRVIVTATGVTLAGSFR